MPDRFSDRIGVTKPREILQLTDINEPLRNSLWNVILECFGARRRLLEGQYESLWESVLDVLVEDFFKLPLDTMPRVASLARGWLHETYFKLPWYEVYNLVEFIVHRLPRRIQGFPIAEMLLIGRVNGILTREVSGYRFVDGVLAPISNETEVQAIEEAGKLSAAKGLNGVHTHIRTALTLLAQKPTPEYRNSIKESISAVEAAAKVISGEEKATLGPALDALQAQIPLHGALKKGFLSIYGYTNDADGIRHALMDEPNVGLDEAKFMLVSCSAFATYLISKAAAIPKA
jgi:hypothetical protein